MLQTKLFRILELGLIEVLVYLFNTYMFCIWLHLVDFIHHVEVTKPETDRCTLKQTFKHSKDIRNSDIKNTAKKFEEVQTWAKMKSKYEQNRSFFMLFSVVVSENKVQRMRSV